MSTPQQPVEIRTQTRAEIINDFKTTLNGLMDISDTYAEQALNLQAVFVQIKRQAKGMISNLDKQLTLDEDDPNIPIPKTDSTTDNEGNDKTVSE